jgi:integrase
MADETADPKFIAADLMSQAEHDKLASSILLTTSEEIADKTIAEIERQMQYQQGIIKLAPLKTRNARRKIFMNERLKNYLLELKNIVEKASTELCEQREQKKIILPYGENTVSSLELVNSLPDGKIQTVNSMKYHSQKIKADLGITFKFHYLRHTYGTRLAEQNLPSHILCNQMGHSSARVAQKYYLAVSESSMDILKDKTSVL